MLLDPSFTGLSSWSGLSAVKSLQSSVSVVRGLEFKMASILMYVCKVSFVGTICPESTAAKQRFTVLKRRSQTPPQCGADGGFQCHWMPLRCRLPSISFFQESIRSANSFDVPMKLLPLSEYVSYGTLPGCEVL